MIHNPNQPIHNPDVDGLVPDMTDRSDVFRGIELAGSIVPKLLSAVHTGAIPEGSPYHFDQTDPVERIAAGLVDWELRKHLEMSDSDSQASQTHKFVLGNRSIEVETSQTDVNITTY